MARRQQRTRLPREAELVQRQIRAWRETKRNGAPMPEELWEAAAWLAREHGLYSIARGLPVDYGALKKRLELLAVRDGDDATGATESTGFVEIDAAQLIGSPEPYGPVVELARPDGARMVIRLPPPGHGGSLDVAGLAAAFCGGGA